VYLLYLDESGTHAGSPAFIVAGIAVHEHDAWHLQRALEDLVRRGLPAGFDAADFELHAAEMKEPRRVRLQNQRRRRQRPPSPWEPIQAGTRFWLMHETYRTIASYVAQDATYPVVCFGVVVDDAYQDREERAYEEILHRFDELLTRQAHSLGVRQRGIVIHDKRVVERDIQGWTEKWRRAAGRIGVLHHLSDVPLFADSKATRLLQAADFVSWALWRKYGSPNDPRWLDYLWPLFDGADGVMHGLVHVHPGFQQQTCMCPPCVTRTLVFAAQGPPPGL
jgi:hypothetical protein